MKKSLLFVIGLLITMFLSAQDYSQVYLIGGAMPNGWANDKAEKMDPVEGEDAVFSWTGILKAGDFKLINKLNTWQPAFCAVTDGKSVVLGEALELVYDSDGSHDYKFKMQKAGTYTVRADLKKLTLVVTEAESNLPKDLWITGTAIPGGVIKLVASPDGNPLSFRYAGELEAGEFKIMTTETVSDQTQYVLPQEEDVDVAGETTLQLTEDADVAGWSVAVAATYKISINLGTDIVNGEIFQPQDALYIIGGATAAGWSVENAIPFVKDVIYPYIFVFEGELKEHSDGDERNMFKILGQKDWGPYNLHPYKGGESILDSKYFLANQGDDKWSVPADKQGFYKITVNLLEETILGVYTGITGLSAISTKEDILLSSQKGTVEITTGKTCSATLIDLSGRQIAGISHRSGSFTLGIGIPAGIYILRIQLDNEIYIRKIKIN